MYIHNITAVIHTGVRILLCKYVFNLSRLCCDDYRNANATPLVFLHRFVPPRGLRPLGGTNLCKKTRGVALTQCSSGSHRIPQRLGETWAERGISAQSGMVAPLHRFKSAQSWMIVCCLECHFSKRGGKRTAFGVFHK